MACTDALIRHAAADEGRLHPAFAKDSDRDDPFERSHRDSGARVQAARECELRGAHRVAQAAIMAQRYPELFDGIAAGAPSQFYPELLMWLIYSGKVLTPVAGQPAVLPPAKLQLLSRSSHALCDAQDGLADGQITNPRTCAFSPNALRCTGADSPDCLTDAQLAAANAMSAGMRTSAGAQRYAGVMPGSEVLRRASCT